MAKVGRPRLSPAEQGIRNGPFAAAVRQFMTENKIGFGAFNKMIGKSQNYSPTRVWLSGKTMPVPETRARIAEVMGMTLEELDKKTNVQPAKLWKVGKHPRSGPRLGKGITALLKGDKPAEYKIIPPPNAPVAKVKLQDVLSFVVNSEGEAHLKLDVTLPVAQAIPLFRVITDHAELKRLILDDSASC